MMPGKYIYTLIACLLVLSGLVAVFNYIVNPFLVADVPRISGFNQFKSEINSHVRLAKSFHPHYKHFNVLIVGNSRVEMGINPTHECFQSFNGVYNLGIPGAGILEQAKTTLELIEHKPIKYLLIGVDFTDFLVLSTKPSPGIEQSPAREKLISENVNLTHGSIDWGRYRNIFKSVYSLDALVSSVKTILLQNEFSPDRDENGFNPARDFLKATKVEGATSVFHQKEQELQKKYSKDWRLMYRDGSTSIDFEYFAWFLSQVVDQDIKVKVFINPLHERFWKIMEQQGLMDQYPIWISKLEAIIRQEGKGNIEFWDFSSDSPYIHEPLNEHDPAPQILKWFWEPAHYRKELGDLMVNTMYAESCKKDEVFGEKIFP